MIHPQKELKLVLLSHLMEDIHHLIIKDLLLINAEEEQDF
jgi:hypothetical protein